MRAFALSAPDATVPAQANAPVPEIAPDELLVRIRAIGVGIHDSYFLPEQKVFPYPIGIEAAGEIEAVGDALTSHEVGDPIAFVSMMQTKGGTWAEYAAVDAGSMILPIPEGMTFEQAAAIPVGGNSALRAMHALPAPTEGGTLFVAGASGAVGSFVIQVARQWGWDVAASASPANHDYLVELGAGLTVDYRDPAWPAQVLAAHPGGVDGAIAIQPNTTTASLEVVKTAGTAVTVSADEVTSTRGITVTGLNYGAEVIDELAGLMGRIVAGDMRLEIERVYAFDEAADALAKVQSRHARGKVVISLR